MVKNLYPVNITYKKIKAGTANSPGKGRSPPI